MTVQTYWCEHAWLPDGPAADVALTVDNGTITAVRHGAPQTGTVLRGLVLPGFANAHSHAFHRALRGRTHGDGGTFWTWREQMYAVAQWLGPDSYYRLARAAYTELVLAGYTAVGEFHYVHHQPSGRPYADPNAMTHALEAAAADAGIRLTVLDSCYLSSDVDGSSVQERQRRFSDGDADAWAGRVAAFRPESPLVRLGAAVHSVRAVPAKQLAVVASWAEERGAPLHAHVSEQVAENDACIAVYGRTPTALLADAGVVNERFVAVHATHVDDADIALLGSATAGVCLCPTTERDLGDGIGPGGALADAGAVLCVGSDAHAVVDPFAELQAVEMHERLRMQERGRFGLQQLVAAGARHAAIGWPEVGTIEVGAAADLVVLDTTSVRTAGSTPEGVPMCASAGDVRAVAVAGSWVVSDGQHHEVADPAAELASAVGEVLA